MSDTALVQLHAAALWLAGLNPFALAALSSAAVAVAFFVGCAIVWLALAILSGAGETNDGEVEIDADDARAFSEQVATTCRASGYAPGNPPFGEEGDE